MAPARGSIYVNDGRKYHSCAHCNKARMTYRLHYFVLHEPLWFEVCARLHVRRDKLLCRACMAKGLRRPITQLDLLDCPVNEGWLGFDKTTLPAR